MTLYLPTLEDVTAAHARILPYIRQTPIIRADRLVKDQLTGQNLFFKLETLQITGSFKARGALNKMLQIPDAALKKGLVTASGGNHGKAVAYAARLRGISSQIYIPVTTPEQKADLIRSMGGDVVRQGSVLDESSALAQDFASHENKTYIHGFKDPDVVAGNGTLALEILRDLPQVDTLLVACGGGGMLAGVAVAAKALKPSIKIIGIEPTGAPTVTMALKEGKVVRLPAVNTKAGTLALASTSEMNLRMIQQNVDDMLLVTDEEMIDASRWLWTRFGIAAEMSASAGIAAIISGKYTQRADEIVCSILCGAGDDGIRSFF